MEKLLYEYNKLAPINTENLSICDSSIVFHRNGEYIIEYVDDAEYVFLLDDGVFVKLFLYSKSNDIKINNIYTLGDDSKLEIYEFFENKNTHIQEVYNLNGLYSTIYNSISSISRGCDNYHLIINHNNNYCKSNINVLSVGLSFADIKIKIDSNIEKGNRDNVMEQTSRILTLSDKVKASIIPNMYTHDNSVIARHGSVVGMINEDELFYLQSRGINRHDSILLLIKGFLFSKVALNLYIRSVIMESILNLSEDDINE